MKAVAYVRGSTAKQRNTLETQQRTAEDYCRYQKLDLTRVFIDSDECGANSFYSRPQARALLDYCAAEGVRQIVMSKLDRSFRNAKDCLTVIDELRGNKGYEFHILDCQLDTRAATGRMFMTILAAIAEWENGRRRERQLENFQTMRLNHHCRGNVPYGWTAVESERTSRHSGRRSFDLIPNPIQQTALKLMLSMHNRGVGLSEIARHFNEKQIPSARGGLWRASTVDSVISHAHLADSIDAKTID